MQKSNSIIMPFFDLPTECFHLSNCYYNRDSVTEKYCVVNKYFLIRKSLTTKITKEKPQWPQMTRNT